MDHFNQSRSFGSIQNAIDAALPGYHVVVRQTVEAAINNLDVSIKEHQASITVGALPRLRVDTSNFIRLFQNLIGNSLKYRSAAPPVIDISCEKSGKEWRFCIRDNGIGINPAYLDKIFVIFKRLHSKTKYPGTGIGLALCKKIIDRHGGRIWADSSGAGGTTFYFTLLVEHDVPCKENLQAA